MMSLVIDLPKETEELLAEEATRRGVPTSKYAQRLIERQLPKNHDRPKSKMRATGYGILKHTSLSSESYAIEKQRQIEREDRPPGPDR